MPVRAGVEARALETVPGGRRLVLADGTRPRHELVVVADGSRSALAGQVAPRKVVPYPWGALFFVGPYPDTLELQQIARGARTFMGVLPMGGGRASLFWSLRADRLPSWRAGFDGWRRTASRSGRTRGPLVDAIGGPDEVLFAPYFDVRMKRWHGDRAVAIGDAAHATSPQLGQGSNLALWDALALSEALAAEPDVDRALALYGARRRRHLAYYQRATRWLTPFFQGDSRFLGWVRDWAFPLGQKLGPVRRLMRRARWLAPRRDSSVPASRCPGPGPEAPLPRPADDPARPVQMTSLYKETT
ncbi:MAG: NAD(P)/FAD-dependent oxidoreductase [Myxococcota bacterium]